MARRRNEKSLYRIVLSLLIFVVDRPTLKYIPEFYKAASDDIKNQFVETINRRLQNMDAVTKTTWWNSWLKRFIENRKNNKPVKLLDSECNLLFKLLPKLDFVFDDAVKIMCKGKIPSVQKNTLWYELDEKNIATNHPQSVAKLIVSLLSSVNDLGFDECYVINIVNNLQGLEEKTQKQLQEVLLKHNISVV